MWRLTVTISNSRIFVCGVKWGEKFSKLDLKNAYNQVLLDESFREFVTINTPKLCDVPFWARLIAFSLPTLSKVKKNYAQVERKTLGIIYPVKKFHHYFFAKKLKITTDHKAQLATILGSKTGILRLTAERLQRWAMFLIAYDYEIEFRPTR